MPQYIGTIPQWGMLLTMLSVLAMALLRYLPARTLAANDRMRAAAAADATAAETWREIEQRVAAELDECRRDRAEDAQQRARLDEENFRLRVVLSMALSELAQLDPESQIILKAQAILNVPPQSDDQVDEEKRRLDELLACLDAPPAGPRRAARPRRKK